MCAGRSPKGGLPPFFVSAGPTDIRVCLALAASLAFHAVWLALPVAVDAGRGPGDSGPAAVLEVRLRGAASPPLPVAATEPPESLQPPPQAGVPLPERYFQAAELDAVAAPIELAPLIYPEGAYLRRIAGQVKVRLFIDASGAIDAVDILEAVPPGLFESAALDALLKTRFVPARLLGQPVRSVKTISVRFDPYQDRPPPAGEAAGQ